MSDAIYLDFNATAPILPAAADAVREASLRFGANPGSQHEPGREARRALENARERIGELLGARLGGANPDRLIFTSGGTEANNLALLGLRGLPGQHAVATLPSRTRHLITSAIEHPSVIEPAAHLQQLGWQVSQIGVDENGAVRLDEFDDLVGTRPSLVSLMMANNETGVLQPVETVAKLCREHGIPVHCDAAQAVGKIPVDFARLQLSMLSCAAHKFQGPLGIGVLVVRNEIVLHPIMFGGHQQADLRPGTDTLALAAGMCEALEFSCQAIEQRGREVAEKRDQLEQLVLKGFPRAMVIGRDSSRLPNTSNIAFVGLDRQALVMALDLEGVACSTGSACSSGSSELSPTHLAMGLDPSAAEGAVRFSLGISTTAAEIDEAARRILFCCQRLERGRNL
ncbi:MAG: cysteine desulfurase [Planctomycetales bacterium]|nr:cysteine desulfurase [Planctomycetales bacterium]